jgi:MFS family permease
MFAIFFFLSLNMQQTYGYTPLQAGIRILPVTLCVIVAAPIAGRLAAKHGPHVPLIAGLLLAAAAQLALLTLEADSSYASYAWALPLSGLGLGMTMTPMTAAVMNAVPASRAGMASATTNTSREIGGNFGIAFIGALLVAKFTDSLNDKLAATGVPAAARDAVITSATSTGEASHGTAPGTPMAGLDPAAVTRMVNESFINGLHVALMVAAAFLLVAAVVAARTIPGRRVRHGQTAGQTGATPHTSEELPPVPA